MRGLLLFTIVAVAVSQVYAVPKCPPNNGPEDILLPNPADCTTYYECLNGNAILMHCPPGLEWSTALNRCEYHDIAKCTETEEKPTTVQPTTSTSGPKPPRPTECPAENGPEDVLLPNPEDCGSFYKCLNGIPHLIQCPVGQEWSIELNRCDFPEIAHCKETGPKPTNKPTTSTSAGPTTPKPTKCPAVDGPEDVLLPNPADCGSFFKCLKGEPHLIQCPTGQEWSIELNRCDFPEIAKCKESARPVRPLPSAPKNKCPAEDGPVDVLLPNPADCGSFYKCLAGSPILQYCPAGLHWSVEYNRCEYPEIAKCKETEEKPSTTTTTRAPLTSRQPPVEKPDHCPAEDGPTDVLLPNPADCGSFFKCLGGVGHLIACPPGLHWSIDLNRCEYPNIANCQKIASRSSRTFSLPTGCPAENGVYDFFISNPENCATYYRCDNGRPILMECPVGTLWHSVMLRCDHAHLAVCATE